MKTFLKYLGVFLVLVGVLMLAAYYFNLTQLNGMLLGAMGVMVIGVLTQILMNKYIE